MLTIAARRSQLRADRESGQRRMLLPSTPLSAGQTFADSLAGGSPDPGQRRIGSGLVIIDQAPGLPGPVAGLRTHWQAKPGPAGQGDET